MTKPPPDRTTSKTTTSKAASSKTWQPPLSRPVAVATLPGTGLELRVEPSAEERAAMAHELGLAAVDKLNATVRLTPGARGVVAVTGEVVADVQPFCVVTLEAFPLRVRELIDLKFAEPEAEERRPKKKDKEEVELDLSSEDPPDAIENGIIDAGQVVTEFLALAVPMFPRKPGATFAEEGDAPEPSPFAALNALKNKT